MGNTSPTTLKPNGYNQFVDYLSTYIISHTFIIFEFNQRPTFIDEICHIIASFCNPKLKLLYDFNGFDDINEADVITSIGMECHDKTQSVYNNKTTSMWISFRKHIINYCDDTNTVSKPIPNTVSFHMVDTNNYPQTTENKTISNIKSCFVLQSSRKHVFIANNGYSNYKTLIGAPANFGHWRGFIVPFRGLIGPPDKEFTNNSEHGINFIITEICNLLWNISVCSVTTVSIGTHPRKRMKYATLYKLKKKNKGNILEFSEFYSNIRVKQQKYNKYEESYSPWYILDIQTIFDYKKHILFVYDQHLWVLYVPLNTFKNSKCINLQNKNKNQSDIENTKQIEIDMKLHLLKKNSDYLLFCGKTYLLNKKFARICNGITNDWIYKKYFDAFESTLNDTENKRFIVAHQSKLYCFPCQDLNVELEEKVEYTDTTT